jgi:DNA polymerase-3 subunit gamma/tau
LLYSMCLHGRADLGLAPDEYAALTMVLLRLLAFKPQGTAPSAEKKTLNSPKPVAAAPNLPTSQPTAQPSPSPLAVQPWEDAPQSASQVLPELTPIPAKPESPPAHPIPTGQRLPVRDSAMPLAAAGFQASNRAPAQAEPARAATKIIAIPVRQASESRADASAGQATAVLIPTDEGNFWHATVQQLIAAESINAMVRELALQAQLVARDTDQWIVRVERESLNQSNTRERLTQALQAAGFDIKLVVEVGRVTDSPARRNSAAASERQLAAEKIIFDDPFVQSMMRDFGAKIIPGSIKPL